MAVRIRLRRMGRKKQPHYRIVVADSDFPRDGRFVENLGYYKPLSQPARLVLDLERVDHWIGEGASPSGTVKNLIARARKGGDDKVVVGQEDVEARKREETEALQKRRATERTENREAGAEKAAAAPTTEPEDRAENPEGSSAGDATAAEAMAEGEKEAVAQVEAREPNEPVEESTAKADASKGEKSSTKAAKKTDDATPKSKKAAGAKAGGEVMGEEEVQAPAIEVPEVSGDAEGEAEESEEA